VKRQLSPLEIKYFNQAEQRYLLDHPEIRNLQPHMRPDEALYLTWRHGAVTIGRAIELDALHNAILAKPVSSARTQSCDAYSNSEDTFIDMHGISSVLD